MISHILHKYKRLIKFSIVGVINTLVDFIIFIFLNEYIGVNYIFSQVVGYSGGVINSFVFNKIWTFNHKSSFKKTPVQLVQFIAINLISFTITLTGMRVLVGTFGMNIIVSKVMVTILAQFINFTGSKYIVFKS